jgi:repressor of nif and glnA expression
VINTKIFDLISKKSLSTQEIHQELKKMGIKISVRNINKRLMKLQKQNIMKAAPVKRKNIDNKKKLEENKEGGV